MSLPRKQIEATEARYAERQRERDELSRKLREGPVLAVDEPPFVEKRLSRLARGGIRPSGVARGIIPSPAPASRPAEGLALERILGQSDLMSINYLELALRVARTVGRVQIRGGGGRLEGYGTAFMISPRLLMTNNHVLESVQQAGRSRVEFNYQEDLDGRLLAAELFELDPAAFFLTDEELDYTIVAVRADSSRRQALTTFGWNRLIEDEGKVIVGEYVNIIQHPNGEPKQIALRENQIKDRLEHFLHYQTDTAPGSSGSPVFNDQWEVVALHHSGVPRRDAEGRILTRDGAVWTEDMGEHRIAWIANEGARLSRILGHVKQRRLGAEQRRLRDELFEAEIDLAGPIRPVPPRQSTAVTILPSEQPGPGTSAAGQPTVEAAPGGAAVWTIPIQVSVQLGRPVLQGEGGAAGGPAIRDAPAAGSASAPSEDDAELREALRELEAGRRRPYYDEVLDVQERSTYYRAVIEGGLGSGDGAPDPAEAYARLGELLRQTHRDQLPYRPGTHVYPWVDLHPNGKIRSIYSGREYDPETLIREDFRVEQERTRLVEGLRRSSGGGGLGEMAPGEARLQEALDLMEAMLPFNCEHVVPQSWYDKRQPMRGDLHHLFACESGCNSFRGNAPYVDFSDFGEALRSECGKKERGRFEPEAGKGAVARATLYFLLRYPGEIDQARPEYVAEDVQTLLQWHRDDPPAAYEKHRNAAIYEKQGNRNPLIDFPEWADSIDFGAGLGQGHGVL